MQIFKSADEAARDHADMMAWAARDDGETARVAREMFRFPHGVFKVPGGFEVHMIEVGVRHKTKKLVRNLPVFNSSTVSVA